MLPVSEFGSVPRNRFVGQQRATLFPESDLCAFSPAVTRSASRDGISFLGDQERADDQAGFEAGSNFTGSFKLHDDRSFWKVNNVQVIIRIRPLNSSEISLHGHRRCVRQDGPQALTWVGQPQSRFTFDIVADENVTQEMLFKVAGAPMVENCIGGYNSCMFAYGQTGSGKTHTMLGDIEGGTRRHNVNCGMTPRVFEYLFSSIQKEKEARKNEKLKFTCRCSFLEIYNEHILDLLDPSSSNLQIREDVKRGVYVENITEFEVSSAYDVMQRLFQGASNRKVASTNMNRASSRSHSVFTCVIESKWETQGVTHHRFARLNLVDLAGSERQKSSGAEGDRLKEATNINKSLSTLGLVIMNLVNISNGKPQHVPYRDSKLTFLLQDSLGGNSKTIIIANISPSNCCSLETLSTLKFAQRAKFIRNDAIVNEDALGDVVTMRLQIQQLKKEVSRLRALANGGSEHQEIDSSITCFPCSPGPFKWDTLQGPLVPLTSDENNSKKRDLEAALVAAVRREQDKEAALRALNEQHRATLQLAKQRDAQIQSLKMRLRFREAGIKRLEALASSKITPAEHLLQDQMELMKELDVLRGQADRNLEVTRFAMENLTLKEELKKFQSFYDGEREMLVEQVDLLQEKLAEALEWKLMHEKAADKVQEGRREASILTENDNNVFTSIQDISSDMDYSFISDENEVLQVQAIQYQRELEAVRKNLKACLDAKEKLERRVGDLVSELEEEKKAVANFKEAINGQTYESGFPSTTDQNISIRSDAAELKAMVDAIAAASHREAEAHETAIFLEKQNIELQTKVKVLLEDNAKLIEMYEGAVSVNVNDTKITNMDSSSDQTLFCNTDMGIPLEDRDDLQMKTVKFLEQQLDEMHEENDKLMELYEKAMQERDDLKRILQDAQNYSAAVNGSEGNSSQNLELITVPNELDALGEELEMAVKKLDKSNERLVRALEVVNIITEASCDIQKFLNEIETSETNIWLKEQEIGLINLLYSETGNLKSMVDDRLHAFKDYTLKLSETTESLDQREAQAIAATSEISSLFNKKQRRSDELQTQKDNLKFAHSEAQKQELFFTNVIANLRSRLEVSETQRKETEKALFTDCTNRSGLSMEGTQSLQLGNAAELLKAEEERIKLSGEMKDAARKLKNIRKEARVLKSQYDALDIEFRSNNTELTTIKRSLEDANLDLSNLISERDRLIQSREAALEELQWLILDYQMVTFEFNCKLDERMIFQGELQAQLSCLKKLEEEKVAAIQKISQISGDKTKIEEALRDAQTEMFEAKASLVSCVTSLSL